MRTSALVLSALLSTGIIAHPLHAHHKRDEDAKLVNSYTKDGKLYQEYVKTVTVYAGQKPAGDGHPKKKSGHKKVVVAEAAPAPSPSPSPPAPSPVVQEKLVQDPVPSPSSTPDVQPAQVHDDTPAPTKDDTPAPSSGGSCSSEAAGGDAWPESACSGGKTIVDQFNEMRAQWDPSLKSHPYTWDTTLAKNSHDTAWAPDGMNKAEVMGHKLYSGSMGQCIAGSFGGKNTFYEAAKMWMCEIKQGPFCDKQTYGIGEHPTGHADIIKSLSYSKVGCYYMYKDNDPSTSSAMYVCDFA